MHKPEANYEEKCYYHRFKKDGQVEVYQPKLNKGLEINFDTKCLPFLTEWKMLGIRDYVLGVEPGNCTPDGRNTMRSKGLLEEIKPNETKKYCVKVRLFEK